jgi:hypothetical protein
MSQDNVKPKIDLFMYSINQEFPVGKHHRTFLKNNTEIMNWSADHHNDWNTWMGNEAHDDEKDEKNCERHPLTRLILREEEFGGIIYDPYEDRVYKVNPPGFRLIKSLVQAAGNETLHHIQVENSKAEDNREFFDFLRRANLWVA